MARTAIAILTLAGPVGSGQTSLAAAALTNSDPTNEHEWTLQDGDMLYARNVDVSGHVIDVFGNYDAQGRDVPSGQSTINLAAGASVVWGPLTYAGWADSSGKVLVDVDGSAGNVEFGVLRKP